MASSHRPRGQSSSSLERDGGELDGLDGRPGDDDEDEEDDDGDARSLRAASASSEEEEDLEASLRFLQKLAAGADLAEAELILGGDNAADRRDELLKAHLATSVAIHEWRGELRRLAELETIERRILRGLKGIVESALYLPKEALSAAPALLGSGQVVCLSVPPGSQFGHQAGSVTITAPPFAKPSQALVSHQLSAPLHVIVLKQPMF